MPRDEHHVVPNSNGGWDVVRNNAKRASAHKETKSEAVQVARKMSKNQNTEMVIHGRDWFLLLIVFMDIHVMKAEFGMGRWTFRPRQPKKRNLC